VCITAPGDGAVVNGVRTVTGTATVNGTDPGIARLVFLKDTGVKLHHLDRQLATRDTVLADLTRRIEE